MRLIETLAHREIEEILREMYVDEDLKLEEMQKELSVARQRIARWNEKAGIYSKRLKLEKLIEEEGIEINIPF